MFLNPAAFATPTPGTFGNLERNSIHGPSFRQMDMVISKRFEMAGSANIEFRLEVFNLFNTVNFSNPAARCRRMPDNAPTEANTRAAGSGVSRRPPPARSADHQHGRPNRRPRHQPSGAVRAAFQLLRVIR